MIVKIAFATFWGVYSMGAPFMSSVRPPMVDQQLVAFHRQVNDVANHLENRLHASQRMFVRIAAARH